MKHSTSRQPEQIQSDEDIRKLVVARLRVLSPDVEIVVGDNGAFSPTELINHVNTGDDLGLKIQEIELHWLRSWKDHANV